jgi:hypothetical protein
MNNNKIYQQIHGTAMGTPLAVVYANLVLTRWEYKIFDLDILLYKRYIDDIFTICHKKDTDVIISILNSQCPTIQLDLSSISKGIQGTFLDLDIKLDYADHKISHKLYQKSINRYMFLPQTTAHPKHMLENFVKAEVRRFVLNSTLEGDLQQALQLFHQRLIARGYKKKLYYLFY